MMMMMMLMLSVQESAAKQDAVCTEGVQDAVVRAAPGLATAQVRGSRCDDGDAGCRSQVIFLLEKLKQSVLHSNDGVSSCIIPY